ncbi:MAG: FCD domain-containing protein [Pseudomonadota bacterium]
MPFHPVAAEKLSHAVIRQIELLILRGILRPGERLPSERDLAERFNVSRPSLRDALSALQDVGLLKAKPGAGIYVADVLGGAFSTALIALFSRHDEAVFDYLSFRRDMEGLAAERAAVFASDIDLQVIQTILGKMEAAQTKPNPNAELEAALDAQFHMAIIEASHNVIMLHMMRSMYDLLRGGVFYNRQIMFKRRASRDAIVAQHRTINEALQARAPDAARAAVEAHLDFVEQALVEQQKSERNQEIAKQRLQHEKREMER